MRNELLEKSQIVCIVGVAQVSCIVRVAHNGCGHVFRVDPTLDAAHVSKLFRGPSPRIPPLSSSTQERAIQASGIFDEFSNTGRKKLYRTGTGTGKKTPVLYSGETF